LWTLLLPIVAAGLLLKPFIAVINGFQRLDLANVLLFCGAAVNAVLTVIFLLFGGKVGALLLAELIGAFVNLLVGFWLVRGLLPSIVPNPLRCNFPMAGKICTFSLGLYSGSIMNTVQEQVEKLYLARLVGVVPVGWYGMAMEASTKVRRLPDILLSPVMAAASELDAASERQKISELYFRSHKYVAAIAMPLAVFAVVFAKPLVTLWLGPALSFIAIPFALLVVGNMVLQAGAPIYAVLAGQGILKPSIYTALIIAVLNIVLSLALIARFGFIGAAWGSVIPVIIGNTYYFTVTKRYFEIGFLTVLRRAYLKPVLGSLAAALIAVVAGTRVSNLWLHLLVIGLVFGICYLLGLLLSRFFDQFDISRLEEHVPFARRARQFVSFSYVPED
jgi:O-antigen/teichoic acid export membrane protein